MSELSNDMLAYCHQELIVPRSVIRRTVRGLIAIASLFIMTMAIMGALLYRMSEANNWTIHTHEVIEALKDSLISLEEAETAQRGFSITHNPEFLKLWQAGRTNVNKHIARVQSLTTDNPEQQLAVRQLLVLAQDRLKQLENGGLLSSPTLTDKSHSPDNAKQIMDAFPAQVDVMIGTEKRLLVKRTTDLKATQLEMCATTIILALLALSLMNWIFQITRRAIEEEARRVQALNEEIEQRKRTERALKDTTIKLSSSNTDLQQFAYVASHDLQEPLRAVTGFLSMLEKKQADKLDPDSQRYIQHAVEGALRMRTLINDLLTYARVESRGKEFEPVSLKQVIERVKADLEVTLSENSAKIFEADLPVVFGDPNQLAQLFQNLIVNAIKFRASLPPEIKISACREGDDWKISVQDNGRGFEMEHAERIFVIFQRLQGRNEAPGTGIGLALCKKILERHNGKIWVESEPNSGSTFIFTIPAFRGDSNGN